METRRHAAADTRLPLRSRQPTAAVAARRIRHLHGSSGYTADERVDPRRVERLSGGALNVLAGRDTSDSGGRAVSLAVDGLFNAAVDAQRDGIDVLPMLERIGRENLRQRLKTEARVVDSIDTAGVAFVNRILVVDDCLAEGLLLWLSCGTGVKHNAQLDQPAAHHLATGVILHHRPALLVANYIARLSRSMSGVAELLTALKEVRGQTGQPVFVGDHEHPIAMLDRARELQFVQDAQVSEQEAERFAVRSAQGYANNTDTVMHAGRARWGVNVAVPPGLATGMLRNPEALPPRVRYVWIDTPACRPRPDELRSFTNPVTRLDGSPAPDHAALVCWFFDHFGLPGFDRARCGDYLHRAGFSSEALRRLRHDPYARFERHPGKQGQRDDRNMTRAITAHLDDYRAGVLRVALCGWPTPLVMTGVYPPRGYWIDQDSYARITGWLANAKKRHAHNDPYLFSGLPVAVAGRAASLYPVKVGPRRGDSNLAYRYSFTQAARDAAGRRAAPTVPLPHDDLVRALADALAAAATTPLPRIVDSPDELAAATAALESAESDLAAAERRRRTLQAAIDDFTLHLGASLIARPDARAGAARIDAAHTTDGGRYTMTPQAWQRLLAQHAATEDEIAAGRARLDAAGAAAARAGRPSRLGVADEDLLTLVAALADPRSPAGHRLIRDGLRNVTIQCRPDPQFDRLAWYTTTLAGEFVIHSADRGSFVLPVHLTARGGPGQKMSRRIVDAIGALYEGTPLTASLGADFRRWYPVIRASLGLPTTGTWPVGTIQDRRLRALAMAACHPALRSPDTLPTTGLPLLAGPAAGDAELQRIADQTGEPIGLLRRIRDVYQPRPDRTRFTWLVENTPTVAAAYADATKNRGLAHVSNATARRLLDPDQDGGTEWSRLPDGRLRLLPCTTCGGTRRVGSRLREVTGSICLKCRTDRAGAPGPRHYDEQRHTLTGRQAASDGAAP
jgi:hypothetical protein